MTVPKAIRRAMRTVPGLVLCLAVASCGADGSPGPAGAEGAQGPQGDTGATGAAGASGTNGANGSNGANGANGAADGGAANTVIYSDWLNLKFTLGKDGTTYYSDIAVPDLTSDILLNGDVRVYINAGTAASPLLYALPFQELSGLHIGFVAYDGGIEVASNADFSSFLNPSNVMVHQYRYILIKGAPPTK